MIYRPPQRDCRNEPAYPGVVAVVFPLTAPDWTAHYPTALCDRAYPHPTRICGEWQGRLLPRD